MKIAFREKDVAFERTVRTGSASKASAERMLERPSVAETSAQLASLRSDGGNSHHHHTGGRRREYRDHRFEQMIRADAIDVVLTDLRKNTIRFS